MRTKNLIKVLAVISPMVFASCFSVNALADVELKKGNSFPPPTDSFVGRAIANKIKPLPAKKESEVVFEEDIPTSKDEDAPQLQDETETQLAEKARKEKAKLAEDAIAIQNEIEAALAEESYRKRVREQKQSTTSKSRGITLTNKKHKKPMLKIKSKEKELQEISQFLESLNPQRDAQEAKHLAKEKRVIIAPKAPEAIVKTSKPLKKKVLTMLKEPSYEKNRVELNSISTFLKEVSPKKAPSKAKVKKPKSLLKKSHFTDLMTAKANKMLENKRKADEMKHLLKGTRSQAEITMKANEMIESFEKANSLKLKPVITKRSTVLNKTEVTKLNDPAALLKGAAFSNEMTVKANVITQNLPEKASPEDKPSMAKKSKRLEKIEVTKLSEPTIDNTDDSNIDIEEDMPQLSDSPSEDESTQGRALTADRVLADAKLIKEEAQSSTAPITQEEKTLALENINSKEAEVVVLKEETPVNAQSDEKLEKALDELKLAKALLEEKEVQIERQEALYTSLSGNYNTLNKAYCEQRGEFLDLTNKYEALDKKISTVFEGFATMMKQMQITLLAQLGPKIQVPPSATAVVQGYDNRYQQGYEQARQDFLGESRASRFDHSNSRSDDAKNYNVYNIKNAHFPGAPGEAQEGQRGNSTSFFTSSNSSEAPFSFNFGGSTDQAPRFSSNLNSYNSSSHNSRITQNISRMQNGEAIFSRPEASSSLSQGVRQPTSLARRNMLD